VHDGPQVASDRRQALAVSLVIATAGRDLIDHLDGILSPMRDGSQVASDRREALNDPLVLATSSQDAVDVVDQMNPVRDPVLESTERGRR
jgi:hypothetical protein